MVFIIGYVFGNFSKSKSLTTLTKVAAVSAIVLFIATNVFAFRFNGWRNQNGHGHYNCARDSGDATWHNRSVQDSLQSK
ncbi:MAG: hypothetical protein ABIR81_03470 [Ginsengibacter sp.]